jgi:hypothetical protein
MRDDFILVLWYAPKTKLEKKEGIQVVFNSKILILENVLQIFKVSLFSISFFFIN